MARNKDYEDVSKAYQTASQSADNFRAAICSYLGLSERPHDDELIQLLNWRTANLGMAERLERLERTVSNIESRTDPVLKRLVAREAR